MQLSSLQKWNNRRRINRKYLAALFILYLIGLAWVIAFKCNVNRYLHVEANRTRDVWERLEYALKQPLFIGVKGCLQHGVCIELVALIFNFFGLIPLGMGLRYFYKPFRAALISVAMVTGVEVFQLLTGYGGFRLDDILVNSLGAFFGIWLYQKWILNTKPKSLNRVMRTLIWVAIPLDIFFIVNTILHFPG